MRVLLTLVALAVSACAQTTVINGAGGGGATPAGTTDGTVQIKVGTSLGAAALQAATAAEVSGVELVPNGTFAAGLSGWTVSGDGTGWSIVSGKLHHTPGASNKISTVVTLSSNQVFLFRSVIETQSAGSVYMNLGADCNSDCSSTFGVGSNFYPAFSFEDGASVVELQPDSDSDATFSLVSLRLGEGIVSDPPVGSLNVNIGPYALQNNHDSGGQGSYGNVAIGAGILSSNSTGYLNSGFGLNALSANTSGANNFANGYLALGSNTTGSDNVAIGNKSLSKNLASGGNFALGSSSLFAYAGSAGGNVAIGTATLAGLSDGENNVAIGFVAGVGGTSNDNVLIGPYAGHGLSNVSDQLHVNNSNTRNDLISGNFAARTLSFDATVCLVPRLFADLATCTSDIEGTTVYIKDSPVNTLGATISAGGGTHKGFAVCDGSNWTFH